VHESQVPKNRGHSVVEHLAREVRGEEGPRKSTTPNMAVTSVLAKKKAMRPEVERAKDVR